jgi:hypothetical protein
MGAQRLRQLDGVFIDPFACVKYIFQHLDGGSFRPDFPQVKLQGAAGGHLEVLQQVPESCIRKIIFYLFSGLTRCANMNSVVTSPKERKILLSSFGKVRPLPSSLMRAGARTF